jgi:tripartite-type tricarboxylate transporter receptor subunit TctC
MHGSAAAPDLTLACGGANLAPVFARGKDMAILRTLTVLLFTALSAAPPTALAQAWPAKPISIVVGSEPGSAPDVYARAVSEPLSRLLGQAVIVVNRTGANGNIAAEWVARAPADGYSIWAPAQSQIEINPSAYPNLPWKPADFTGVIKGVEAPVMLVTHPSVPAKTLAEVVAWVKANPGKVSYASFSPGTISHFLGHELNQRFGLDMPHITFKGSGPQVQNLLGGHVPLGFSQIQTGLPHVQSGKLNAVAVTSATRWRQLPAVPTFAELGYPNFTASTWFGLVVHSSTPPDILAKLVEAAKAAHADPAVRARLEQMGFDVSAQTGADPGNELPNMEGFCHGVVGAQLQSEDFIDLIRFCGHHDNRHHFGFFMAPDQFADIQPGYARQHQIKHRQARFLRLDRLPGRLPVIGP